MQKLARTISMPHDAQPVRLPTFPALERSATMDFSYPLSWVLPSSTSVFTPRTILYRDACYPLWQDIKTENANYTYGMRLTMSTSGPMTAGEVTSQTPEGPVSYNTNGSILPSIIYPGFLGPASGAIPKYLGAFPFLGRANGSQIPYIWVPAGDTLMITAIMGSAIAAGTVMSCTTSRYDSPETKNTYFSTLTAPALSGAATVAFVVALSGWYNLQEITTTAGGVMDNVSSVAINVGQGTCSYASTPFASGLGTWTVPLGAANTYALLPTIAPGEFVNASLPWQSCKVTACALSFSNATKALDKEGSVLWGRVLEDEVNVTPAAIAGYHPLDKKFLLMQNGGYTYVPPSGDSGMYFDAALVSTVSTSQIPVFNLDNPAYSHVGFFSDPDGGTVLAMTVDLHIEFRTNSTLFTTGVSKDSLEALHSAMVLLSDKGYFFDRPYPRILGNVSAKGAMRGSYLDAIVRPKPKSQPKNQKQDKPKKQEKKKEKKQSKPEKAK